MQERYRPPQVNQPEPKCMTQAKEKYIKYTSARTLLPQPTPSQPLHPKCMTYAQEKYIKYGSARTLLPQPTHPTNPKRRSRQVYKQWRKLGTNAWHLLAAGTLFLAPRFGVNPPLSARLREDQSGLQRHLSLPLLGMEALENSAPTPWQV